MFTVVSQPRRRKRHAVTVETPVRRHQRVNDVSPAEPEPPRGSTGEPGRFGEFCSGVGPVLVCLMLSLRMGSVTQPDLAGHPGLRVSFLHKRRRVTFDETLQSG